MKEAGIEGNFRSPLHTQFLQMQSSRFILIPAAHYLMQPSSPLLFPISNESHRSFPIFLQLRLSCYSNPQLQQAICGNSPANLFRQVSIAGKQVGELRSSYSLSFPKYPIMSSLLQLCSCPPVWNLLTLRLHTQDKADPSGIPYFSPCHGSPQLHQSLLVHHPQYHS